MAAEVCKRLWANTCHVGVEVACTALSWQDPLEAGHRTQQAPPSSWEECLGPEGAGRPGPQTRASNACLSSEAADRYVCGGRVRRERDASWL